jgi:hypothetical protein
MLFSFQFRGAATSPQAQKLHTEVTSIEQQKRSALLSLYSLDSRLGAPNSRHVALRGARTRCGATCDARDGAATREAERTSVAA